jgi:predicted nucleic acid-binding protein
LLLSTSQNNFWDTNVLARYLSDQADNVSGDIARMVEEARNGDRKIWHSTLLYAEFHPEFLNGTKYKTIADLIADLEGVLLPVAPNADVMMRSARLRQHRFERPVGIRERTEKPRVLTTPDAIQLATALHIKEALKVPDLEFLTFDDGKTKNYETTNEHKTVSLLHLQDYSGHLMLDPDVKAACELRRVRPILRQQNLDIP